MLLASLENFEKLPEFSFYICKIYKETLKFRDFLRSSLDDSLISLIFYFNILKSRLAGSVNENDYETNITKKRSSKVTEKRSSEPPRNPSLLDRMLDILKWIAGQILAVIVPSAALFIYHNISNLLYYNETNLIITFVISVFFALSITWIEGYLHLPIQIVFKFVIYIGIAFTVIYIIAPYFIPPFGITDPENGDSVGMIYTVRGHGAIPGSSVKVYLKDDIGNEWLQGTVSTTQDGKWECDRAVFGRAISNDIGKNFTIYAITLNQNNEIYETPHITVTRS